MGDDWNGEEEEFNVDDDEYDDDEGIDDDGDVDDYVNEDTTESETYPIGKEEQDINFDKNAMSTNENIPGNTAQAEVNGETNTDEWWDDDEGSMISFPVLFALAVVVGLVFYWKKRSAPANSGRIGYRPVPGAQGQPKFHTK